MSKVTRSNPTIFFPNVPVFVKPKGNFLTSKGTLNLCFIICGERLSVCAGVVTFVTRPNMGKFELKQYLERVYGLGVIKVNTQVTQGKMKRDMKGKWFRHRSSKKAIVTVDNSSYLDRLQAIAASDASTDKKAE